MKQVLFAIATCGFILFGVKSCNEAEWYAQAKANAAAQQREMETPRVIREVDGCKVYAFRADDRWHYFTRCANSKTTTESSYTVTCGKNCTRTETETIVGESHE